MSATHDSMFPEPDPMTIDSANLGSVDPLSVEGIFLVALSKTGTERETFLNAQCADQTQRQRVEALLVAYEQAGDFLQKPAVTSEPTPIGQYLAPCELPGTLGRLGPYEILEEIGRGGMGVVFRAHDPKLQRIVAVKALAPELARLPTARQRFLREARAAAAISHPHVVTIFAVEGTEEASLGTERTTLPYLVMECVVGQTLHDKIKRVGALKVEEIVRISRQMAEGLTAAHKRGLIHRDIKPANILLENGVERVKITDFGLARTTSDGGITHTGEILGTPQCMSPEQARGEIVDQRSDLFSLGCVMYTMCTGVSPFRADNMLAVMKKVCEVNPRPVAQMNPNIPEWLCELVRRLLEKEPERRMQTAGDVVSVLESQSSSGEVRAREAAASRPADAPQPASTRPRLTQLARWQRWLPAVVVISAVVGFGLGQNRYSYMMWLPVWTVVAWSGLSWANTGLKLNWTWINWKSFIASVIALFAGANLRVWMVAGSPRSDMEIFLQNYAGMFVFPLALGIFWLLTKLMPWGFIPTQRPAAAGIPLAPVQPRSPWSVLAWIFVALLGLGMFSALGFLTLLIVTHLPNPNDLRSTPPYSDPHPVYVTIRSSLGEKITGVTVDGTPAFVTSLGAGMCQLQVQPGRHAIVVAFESSDPKNYERSYSTQVDAASMEAVEIEAVPVNRPVIQGTVQAIPSTLGASGDDTDNPGSTMTIPAGSSATGSNAPGDNVTAITSIPLVDAIEVLTDRNLMPEYNGQLVGFSEPKVRVWIDEPGLIISLKRLDFEGADGSALMYDSRNIWGVDSFREARTGKPAEVPPGRYQVLVQDLDYGWSVDQRGAIQIGNGVQTVHVRRRFAELEADRFGFPLPFRWAGNSYEITTAEQVAAINGYLTRFSGRESTESADPESLFKGHALIDQIVTVQPPGPWTLKYQPRQVRLKIEGNDTVVKFRHERGIIGWSHSVPEGFRVPIADVSDAGISYQVSYQNFKWPQATSASLLVDPLSETPVVVPPLSRKLIKQIVMNTENNNAGFDDTLVWFQPYETYMSLSAVPAARRLVLAWVDGQPDVPESELLAVIKESSGSSVAWEHLWQYGAAEIHLMTSILEPGSTPGTWRIKEPPEGAVTQ